MKIAEQITINEIGSTGEGVGYDGTREYHLWNSFPGESVRPLMFKKRQGQVWGRSQDIVHANDLRIEPCEDHFLSCSPWSTVAFEYEQKLKTQTLKGFFIELMPSNLLEGLTVYTDGVSSQYRNKMEYSFTDRDGLSLAFIERMGRRRVPLDSCVLARPEITKLSRDILEWLNAEKVSLDVLKALMIRSEGSMATRAILFVTDPEWKIAPHPDFKNILTIAYSNPQSPMSRVDAIIEGDSHSELSDALLGKSLIYGVSGFFQVNLPLFERALADIAPFVKDEDIVDLYSGTGAISIALSGHIKTAYLADIDENNIYFAQKNILDNMLLGKFTATSAPAESVLDCIKKDSVIIVDPNRPGLHPKLVARLLEVKPKRIIYLSCNPESQARNIASLSDAFVPIHFSAYNFFPRTPHIESLIVLDAK